jgi:hypothetical protein
MPFKSKAQMRYMFAKHPKIAAKWEGKYGISKGLPQHVKKTKKAKPKRKVSAKIKKQVAGAMKLRKRG